MSASARNPLPGATFWVLAIDALALIAFVCAPMAQEYPLARARERYIRQSCRDERL